MTGLCGLNKHAFLVYDNQLAKVRLDGTGGLEPVNTVKPWDIVEGMASNEKSMIFVRAGRMYRLFEDGTFRDLCPGSRPAWAGTTSIFPASDGNYVVTQNGTLHLVFDVDGDGQYRIVRQ